LVSDHDFGITAIIRQTGNALILAIHKIPTATRLAMSAMTTQEADADALTDFPIENAFTDFVDPAHDFMAGDAWKLETGRTAFDGKGISVTNATGLHADADLSFGRRGERAIHEFEFSRLAYLNGAIGVV
jgi:hypothetical protein